MSKYSSAMLAWKQLSNKPVGRWAFSKLVCWKAPYFASIKPQFIALRPGYCELHIKKRRRVLNHLNTVHAIAMCNMAELAGGTMTDASIPGSHRWIPKGMNVEYLKKAQTDLRAIAELNPIPEFDAPSELPVLVKIIDAHDQTVFRAVISMWVSLKN